MAVPDGFSRRLAPGIDGDAARVRARTRGFASRLFGYDIFLSFALGPPPRGTHSYASDLARRLRERDFNVFFSEDEAPPGEQLDNTLRIALLRSKALVVVANRGTLEDPRWVRTEVQAFRKSHPNRPVITINVDGALQDPALAKVAQEWLTYQDKIWLDESEEAVSTGIASDRLVERLLTSPTSTKSNVAWRWVARFTLASLCILVIIAVTAARIAQTNADEAAEKGIVATSSAMAYRADAALRDGKYELALQLAVHAAVLDDTFQSRGVMLKLFLNTPRHVALERGGLSLDDSVSSISLDSLGRQLVAAGKTTVYVLDITGSGVIRAKLNTERQVSAIAFDHDDSRVFIALRDGGGIGIWDLRTGSFERNVLPHEGEVQDLRVSPNGDSLAATYDETDLDSSVILWNAETHKKISEVTGIRTKRNRLAYDHAQNHLIVAGISNKRIGFDEGAAQVFRLPGLRQDGEPMMESTEVAAIDFYSDDILILAGGDIGRNGYIRPWSILSRKPLWPEPKSPRGWVRNMAASPGVGLIAVAGMDDSPRGYVQLIWDLLDDRRVGGYSISHEGVSVNAIALNQQGTVMSSVEGGNERSRIRVWAIRELPSIITALPTSDGVTSAVISPDGRTIYAAGRAEVQRWDVSKNFPSRVVVGFAPQSAGAAEVLAISPNGSSLAIANHNSVTLFRLPSGEQYMNIRSKESFVNSLVFDPSGKRLAIASNDGPRGHVELLDVQTGQLLTLQPEIGWGAMTAFSKRGDELVAADRGQSQLATRGMMRFWRVPDGVPLGIPVELDGQAGDVTFIGSDGDVLVSSSKGGRVWRRREGSFESHVFQHEARVLRSALSHSDRILATAGRIGDQSLRLWDVLTGEQIGLPISLGGGATQVAFSADDRKLVVAHDTMDHIGGLRVIDLSPASWREKVCSVLIRPLTPDEWKAYSPAADYTAACRRPKTTEATSLPSRAASAPRVGRVEPTPAVTAGAPTEATSLPSRAASAPRVGRVEPTPAVTAGAPAAGGDPTCDDLRFDLTTGMMNGVPPTVSQAVVKKAFGCSTGATPDGEVFNYGGGVFFRNHDFYFYTGRDFLEVRREFRGTFSSPFIGSEVSVVQNSLGQPQYTLNTETSWLYDRSYGCLRIEIEGGVVDQLAAHYESCAAVVRWRSKK